MIRPKKIFLLIFVTILIFLTGTISKVNSDSSTQKETLTQSKQADNTISYRSVAEFKTISRKKEYRVGELISIDVALLNKSKESIYFLDLGGWGQISVQNENGKEIGIRGGAVCALRAPSFNLLGNNEYDSSYFIYLIGCDDMYKHYDYEWKSMKDDFDKERFANIGYRCIDTKKPGKYVIKASISNDYSESNGWGQEDKTKKIAVGEIESTPFEITIIGDSKK